MAEGLRVVDAFDEEEEPREPDGSGPKSKKLYNFTDTGNAMRLLRNHADDLLYCAMQNAWYVWDGSRFAVDERKRIEQRAKSTARWIQDEEVKFYTDDDKKRIEVFAHGVRSENAAKIAAMIRMAESDERVAILASDLDRDPYLFNVQNGTIDLRTGEIRPHNKADRLTKLSPIEFDPDATCPTWLRFLERVMDGNQPKIDYLQRWFGYCMTGNTSEEVLAFFWGSGRNGKSVTLRTIEYVMGDYAHSTQAETIMRRDHRDSSNDIAVLLGARLVSTSEIEDGARMAESLVKQLTGGDRVTARRLYADFFTFTPTFKLVIAGNHKPTIRGTDNAIWERIHLVPFTVTIPPEERDPQLSDKLKAEGPGLLNWMLEGCQRWQEQRLQPPAEVRAATNDYREEMDILGGFLADRCYTFEGTWHPASELYASYKEWCSENGERFVTPTRFGLALGERGFTKEREATGARRVIWRGLSLLVDGQPVNKPAQASFVPDEDDEEPPF